MRYTNLHMFNSELKIKLKNVKYMNNKYIYKKLKKKKLK